MGLELKYARIYLLETSLQSASIVSTNPHPGGNSKSQVLNT